MARSSQLLGPNRFRCLYADYCYDFIGTVLEMVILFFCLLFWYHYDYCAINNIILRLKWLVQGATSSTSIVVTIFTILASIIEASGFM